MTDTKHTQPRFAVGPNGMCKHGYSQSQLDVGYCHGCTRDLVTALADALEALLGTDPSRIDERSAAELRAAARAALRAAGRLAP